MSEQTEIIISPDTAPALSDAVKLACDIATGRVQADPASPGRNITGAKKDKNCKGRGPEWYRMVYRGGSWQYISDERLPSGNYLAADRRATVYGDVYPGEVFAQHDRGSAIDTVWLESGEKPATVCAFSKRRDGKLSVVLPDGSVVILPDPRKR